MDSHEHLIIIKQSRFLDEVRRASETIGYFVPYVNFNGCSSFGNEAAHIHIEDNIICVSEHYLERATYEDIKNTAIHEVAHLINATHNFSFYQNQTLIKSHSWKPPIPPRKHMADDQKEILMKEMEEHIRKYRVIYVDENGDEYYLKGRKGFRKYLKDEFPNIKPLPVLPVEEQGLTSKIEFSTTPQKTFFEKIRKLLKL